MGLGQQEEFYGCSDVSIGNNGHVGIMSAMGSTTATTVSSTSTKTTSITTTTPSSTTIEESEVILYPGKYVDTAVTTQINIYKQNRIPEITSSGYFKSKKC